MANFSLARILGIERDDGGSSSSSNRNRDEINSNSGSMFDDDINHSNAALGLQHGNLSSNFDYQSDTNVSNHENDYLNNIMPEPSAPFYDSGPIVNLGVRPKANTPIEEIPIDRNSRASNRNEQPNPLINKLEDMAVKQAKLESTIDRLTSMLAETNTNVTATKEDVTSIRKDCVPVVKPKHKSILAAMYDCPTFGKDFKPVHALTNLRENKYIKEIFQTNINKKFTGIIKNDNRTDYPVIRFLRDMAHSQTMVQLSQKEFLLMLKSRCDPPAYNDVSTWLEQDISAADLYERMANMYKGHINPVQALNDLSSYKIPVNYTFIQVVSELSALAHTASYIELDPANRLSQENTLIMTHLNRVMPAEAKRYIAEITLDYVREEGKSPTIHNIYSSLMERNELLDCVLKTSASKHIFGPPKTYGQNNSSSKKHTDVKEEKAYNGEGQGKGNANRVKGRGLNKINAQNDRYEGQPQVRAAQAFPVQTNTSQTGQYRPNSNYRENQYENNYNNRPHVRSTQAQPPYSNTSNNGPSRNRTNFPGNNFPNTAGRKLFCSGCGMTNHTLTGERGCFALVDDNLKKIIGPTPAFGRCPTCYDKLQMELRHQKVVCPLREKLIPAYRSGKLTARGPIADYLKKQNIIP